MLTLIHVRLMQQDYTEIPFLFKTMIKFQNTNVLERLMFFACGSVDWIFSSVGKIITTY